MTFNTSVISLYSEILVNCIALDHDSLEI